VLHRVPTRTEPDRGAIYATVLYLLFAHVLAAGYGERVLWARWNRAARAGERAGERPVGEVV
jgi:hypothetical protein